MSKNAVGWNWNTPIQGLQFQNQIIEVIPNFDNILHVNSLILSFLFDQKLL